MTAVAVSVLEEFAGVPAVPALAGVAVGEGVEDGFVGGLGVQPLLQDGLDGLVPGVVVMQGAPAGGLEAPGAVPVGQGDQSLDRAQVDQDLVVEQDPDHLVAGVADFPGPLKTPLGGMRLVGEGIGRQVVVVGLSRARSEGADVGGDKFVPMIDGHRLGRGP